MTEKSFKEIRLKLTLEKGIIVPSQTFIKDILKSVHDDVHSDITATQRKLKLQV